MTTQTMMTLPEQLRRMDGARLRAYADNLAFYNGEQWPASMARSRNRRLVFNYAKAIVDKTASYLMSPHESGGVSVAVDPADETAEAATRARAAERALLEVHEQNNLDQLDFDTEIDAAVLGDGAYKVTWDAAERRVRVTAPGLSLIALNVELDPLLKKVARKRLIRGAAYRRRNEMILRILEQYAEPKVSYAPYRSRIVWGSVLPLDRSRHVEDERALVAAGIHSRRRAADNLGVADPEAEFARWLEERRAMGEGA